MIEWVVVLQSKSKFCKILFIERCIMDLELSLKAKQSIIKINGKMQRYQNAFSQRLGETPI